MTAGHFFSLLSRMLPKSRTGGQFGAQGSSMEFSSSLAQFSPTSLGCLERGGQFGASEPNSPKEEGEISEDETEIDSSEAFPLDFSDEMCNRQSERARKTLKQTSLLSKSYCISSKPFLLRMSKKQKKTTFSIESQTFARSQNIIVTSNSTKKILFLLRFTPHDTSNPTFNVLAEIIEDLYIMSTHRSNLTNKKKLSGRMSGIGFRGGYEKGKSAGTYAIRKNLKASRAELDKCLQSKLPNHNRFISNRFRDFSQAAFKANAEALKEFGIPSWSDKAWECYENEPTPLCSNVIVTSNDFSNQSHCDKDKNIFTYGIFSYIDRTTGTPILPPSSTRGHGLRFPEYDCNIEFGTTPGIIEVLWKSNDIAHHTIGPTEELKSTKTSTHFGCSFQISHRLVSRAVRLKKLSKAQKLKRTMNQEERSRQKTHKKTKKKSEISKKSK
ncbi:hypothetical protein PSHT_15981 [Puccinia striiformis]|uniref:Tet-like 2OG-Fe(II) oxygenase domain-containing protein n=1 Tax=Puccinia striiformis TaxID=27350 RepID=A0A2S4UC50_9BASI|nr:hypothetical protein PSHT_15981 [Puccinia striiformis]